MKKVIIIFAPDYDPNCGGSIATHKLCHLLNEMDEKAYIFPLLGKRSISILNIKSNLVYLLSKLSPFNKRGTTNLKKGVSKSGEALDSTKLVQMICHVLPLKVAEKIRRILVILNYDQHSLITNPAFNTPCFDVRRVIGIANNNDFVVIYPEIVAGNPLKAKNVVRWLLHSPGFHTYNINYGQNELYFRFSVETPYFSQAGSYTSEQFLTVVHFPTDTYSMNGVSQERHGSAYCLRKGAGKEIVHDINDSICIDGKSHEQIAEIFKRVKTFYCYDTRTAYYYFASLCGCETIVIPDEGISKEEWLPQPASRVGIRYGIDSPKNHSQSTPENVRKFLAQEEAANRLRIEGCMSEIKTFFSIHPRS
jgi:hypothetical protein